MSRFFRWAGYGALVLVAVLSAGWWAIGPTWRLFLSDPPSGQDVLFWTQDQRDTGFALADQIPIIDTVPIKAGSSPRTLSEGTPLSLKLDMATYMKRQNSAAVVVLHKGAIRFEAYGLNQTKDKRWTSFSVAKSMTSTLVGVAIAQGHIGSLDDVVSKYVVGLRGSAYDDVTIRQLLTMTSGVEWNEDYQDPNSDVARFTSVTKVEGEPAIVTYLKALPRAHQPGAVFNYSTGETNLVGILVEAATGKGLNEYLSETIWAPYGMGAKASWVISGTGEPISGCCVQATARDFARFGQFMLDGGIVGGASILPEGWIEAATRTQKSTSRIPTYNYGYQWWTREDGSYSAIGIFGQSIFVDPTRALVIVTNSSWKDAGGFVANQKEERNKLYTAVQAAIDAEVN